MANLLARLAERTLGLAPVARPATLPLFAPLAPAVVDGLPLEPRPSARRESVEQPGPPVEEPRAPFRQREQAAAAIDPPRERRLAEAAAAPVRPEPRIAAQGVRAVMGAVPAVREESQRPDPVREHRPPAVPASPADTRVADTRVMEAAPAQPPVRAEAQGAPLEQRPEPARATLPPPLWLPKKAEREPAARRVAEEYRQQDSAIEVNIGRIEVRAIFPPAQAASPSPRRADSALSLADYLKQRDRGER